MAIRFEHVDLELDIIPTTPEPAPGPDAADLLRILRSPAFRELLRPIVVEIIGAELDRARRRFG